MNCAERRVERCEQAAGLGDLFPSYVPIVGMDEGETEEFAVRRHEKETGQGVDRGEPPGSFTRGVHRFPTAVFVMGVTCKHAC
jgi:hypothetical protein